MKSSILSASFILLLIGVLVNTQYEIVINLAIIVTTPTNRLVDGSCCLSSESPPQCTSCPNVRLQLCVRDDGADTSNTDITNCTGSSVGIGSGSISGSVTAAFSYDETYTGAFQLLFRVLRNFNATHANIIDSGLTRLKLELVADRSSGVLQQVQITGANGLATFPLGVLVTCPDDVSNCPTDNSCRPRDDLFGHFLCRGGELVCLPGFMDPASDCTQPVSTTHTTVSTTAATFHTPGTGDTTQTTVTTTKEEMPVDAVESDRLGLGLGIGVAIGFTAALLLAIFSCVIVCILRKKCNGPSGHAEVVTQPVHEAPSNQQHNRISTHPNPGYGVSREIIAAPNPVRREISTAPNPGYGVSREISTAPNPGYGVSREINTSPNPGYGVRYLETQNTSADYDYI